MVHKFLHLIPYDGIGGVETAARTMADLEQSEVDFHVKYIFNKPSTSFYGLNPLLFLTAAYEIIIWQPDILIVSLWRSCFVLLLVKLFCPRIRFVLFLHFPKDVHFLDRLLTRLTAKFAHQIWADSDATLLRRLPELPSTTGKVISFVTHRIAACKRKDNKPVFIFWGRIHSQKKIERALTIFANIHSVYQESSFIVIGPDGGELPRIRELVCNIGIEGAVKFTGEMDFGGIKKLAEDASFYLQTSELEGMAMSVVEAMQLGLVPVVTPVGEIGTYCQHEKNSLLITSDQDTVEDVLNLLNNPQQYEQIREKAIATWENKPLYSESVVQACLDIYSGSNNN